MKKSVWDSIRGGKLTLVGRREKIGQVDWGSAGVKIVTRNFLRGGARQRRKDKGFNWRTNFVGLGEKAPKKRKQELPEGWSKAKITWQNGRLGNETKEVTRTIETEKRRVDWSSTRREPGKLIVLGDTKKQGKPLLLNMGKNPIVIET